MSVHPTDWHGFARTPLTVGHRLLDLPSQHYLAGGRPFGPEIVSANITPDRQGCPAGVTLDEFVRYPCTGRDPKKPDEILQVLPWPVYGKMTNADLRAVYEFLSAIPPAEPAPPAP